MTLAEILAALKKVEGGEALASKLETAWAEQSSTLDTLKGQHTALKQGWNGVRPYQTPQSAELVRAS